MKNSNIAFLTTIFPASKNFLDDFLSSLQEQSFKNFDVVIVNDGITDFCKIKSRYQTLNILEHKANFSPAKNREFGIKKVVESGYDYIIFGDSDDFFENTRIETVVNLLNNYDIVINDLHIFSKNKTKESIFSSFLAEQMLNFEFFYEKNIAGLSNTAIKTNILKTRIPEIDEDIIAADWLFFSLLLIQNKNAKIFFTDKTHTFYRQHDNNIIGINNLNKNTIKLALNVKLSHYKCLINYCKKNKIIDFIPVFNSFLDSVKELNEEFKNEDFFNKYLSLVSQNYTSLFKGWWSEIITLKELKYYENKINKE